MAGEEFLKILKIFDKSVRKFREKAKMTTKELSEKSGINEKYIERIEQGKYKEISTSHVYRLADGLSITPHELCKGI